MPVLVQIAPLFIGVGDLRKQDAAVLAEDVQLFGTRAVGREDEVELSRPQSERFDGISRRERVESPRFRYGERFSRRDGSEVERRRERFFQRGQRGDAERRIVQGDRFPKRRRPVEREGAQEDGKEKAIGERHKIETVIGVPMRRHHADQFFDLFVL
jgi:hypothetical protein